MGAWLAMGGGVGLLLAAALYWRREGFRHRARHELNRLERRWRRDGELLPLLVGISQLLRRTARQVARRPAVAGLTGVAWLTWLDDAGRTDGFTRGPGRVLRHGPYQSAPDPEEVDVSALLALVRGWLRRVKRGAP